MTADLALLLDAVPRDAARDVLLRVSAAAVLPLETGEVFDRADVVEALERDLPDRFTPASRAQIARITAASWTQSGHLDGHSRKVRRRVDPAPAAVAYAVLLGYLCGARGPALFETPWAVCLDAPAPVLQDRARGLETKVNGFRHAGGVLP